MLPVTFSIFGTCVSIEIFDYNKDGRLIRTNPLRCNSIFSVSNRFPSYLNIKHKSSYIQPMLRTMFDGTTFDWLKANQGEYLIIDLIEERFPLLKASGTY
ncbi:MAG: DUF6270 domain-containing protein, partial [Bacteroidales bacterium]|nr:DUF6270 domain-containing protein [Bacteroidales bacterium]